MSGRGVTALVSGHRVEIGNPAHLLGAGAAGVAAAQIADLADSGQIARWLCSRRYRGRANRPWRPARPNLQPDDWQGFGE